MSEFDPSEATVEQVHEYIAGVDAEEIARVRAAEEAGRNRSSIHWPQEVDSDEDDGQGEVVGDGPPVVEGVQDEPVADSRPVWNVETHGKPTPAQREFYRVIGE